MQGSHQLYTHMAGSRKRKVPVRVAPSRCQSPVAAGRNGRRMGVAAASVPSTNRDSVLFETLTTSCLIPGRKRCE
eukprot:scaffold54828_cov30-Tisochrysis_lutea.AAC.7